MNLIAGQDTIEKTDALLRSLDTQTLLTAAYSLTHRMHVAAAAEHAARSNGHTDLARQCGAECIDLRMQRNLISDELVRRTGEQA